MRTSYVEGRSGITQQYHSEYRAFRSARYRCNNPRYKDYESYGGRGIRFLLKSFDEFFSKLGPKPTPAHSLDRIDNDKDYALDNIRWATKSEQSSNQRKRRKVTRIRIPIWNPSIEGLCC
jgi:hypothetical protein